MYTFECDCGPKSELFFMADVLPQVERRFRDELQYLYFTINSLGGLVVNGDLPEIFDRIIISIWAQQMAFNILRGDEKTSCGECGQYIKITKETVIP